MNKSKFKLYKHYPKVINKDEEGGVNEEYSNIGQEFKAEIWPASGKLQVAMYGLRLAYMINMITDHLPNIKEGDGIGVENSQKADYKVVSKKKYTKHIVYELEKII